MTRRDDFVNEKACSNDLCIIQAFSCELRADICQGAACMKIFSCRLSIRCGLYPASELCTRCGLCAQTLIFDPKYAPTDYTGCGKRPENTVSEIL